MEAVWILVGVVVGLLGGLGVALSIAKRQNGPLMEQINARTAETDQAKKERDAIALEKARLETQLDEREKAHEARIQAYDDAEQKLKEAFDSISLKNLQKALEEHKKLADGDLVQRQRLMEETLKPFQDRLKDLDGHNRDIEKQRAEAYGELLNQIKALGEEQTGLRKETNRLVKALQDPGSAGAWGEMVLERVVEMAGLQEHYTFDQQATTRDEDGGQRPDMIVNLPGGRTLIIDSKAPMRAYMDGLECTEEEMRGTYFRGHAGKLYDHAKELKRRDYSKREDAPDFTVMFIPSESAFRTALENRPALIEECMECNVVIATPTTLLALLRAVNYGWRQERLAKMADEIRKDAGRLYEALATLTDHYNKLGKALKSAGDAYNSFGGSLETRVLPAARRFKDSGVSSSKDIALVETVDVHPRALVAEELTTNGRLDFAEHELPTLDPRP
jgi:DNA recombination protein RmuC